MRVALNQVVVALSLALAGAAHADPTHTVYVSSNGWHSDITVSKADIPHGRIPESADFASAVYLQFGWGDADYYTTPDPGIGTTLGAALPGPAVLHLAGLQTRPSQTFSDTEEVALTLSAENFARLIDHLHESFARGDQPRAASTAPGVYSFSRFYAATGEFHAFNTCNTWTARGLAGAGLKVSASGVQSAEDVMRQLRAAEKD
jgi:uncharacterized protein (TIGR02117 family)